MTSGWRRVGKLSGPADLYRERFFITRDGARWSVVDHPAGEKRRGVVRGFVTMKEARRWAEMFHRDPSLLRECMERGAEKRSGGRGAGDRCD